MGSDPAGNGLERQGREGLGWRLAMTDGMVLQKELCPRACRYADLKRIVQQFGTRNAG